MAQSSLASLAAVRHKRLDDDDAVAEEARGTTPPHMPVNTTKDLRERSFRIQHAAILGIFLLVLLDFLKGNVPQYNNSTVISDIGDTVKKSLSSSSSTTERQDPKEGRVWTEEDILQSFRNLESGSDICTPFLQTPFPSIWESVFPTIVNASKKGLPLEVSDNANFSAWFQESATFVSFPRLQRSTQHAPEHMQMKAILEKIQQHQKQQQQPQRGGNETATADESSSGSKKSAVQIHVMGTSQTSGVGCLANPIQNFNRGNTADSACAWPGGSL
jgi:hypothetical protein